MLTPYCQTVLRRELAGSDYDGKTADAAWRWLALPTPQPALSAPTGVRLTPVVLAGLVGAAKAEACASALKSAYPLTADHLMEEGIDPTRPEAAAFVTALVTSGVLSQADADLIRSAAVRSVPQPDLPRRFDTRFEPVRWRHVAADGAQGDDTDPAIHSFPNTIDRPDFDAAWVAAGRN